MARLTENPKFIGIGILLSLVLGAYLYLPDLKRMITAPPKKPRVAAAKAKPAEDPRFYRMIPEQLPDKMAEVLAPTEAKRTIFDEVPRRQKTEEERGEAPKIPEGWRLTSVWISPDKRAAVISGQVVMEGEVVGPFTVAKIEPDRLVLRHPYGERILPISRFVPPPAASTNAPATESISPEVPTPTGEGPPPGLIRQAVEGVRAWQKNQKALDQILPSAQP